jgi:hypothetical protein
MATRPTIGDLVDLLTDDTNSAGRRRAGVALLRDIARADLAQSKDPDTEPDLTVPADDDAIGVALLVVAGEAVSDLVDALQTLATVARQRSGSGATGQASAGPVTVHNPAAGGIPPSVAAAEARRATQTRTPRR